MSIKTRLDMAVVEKDVENIYREALRTYLHDAEITSPYNCDGLLKSDNIRSIMEFKYDEQLKSRLTQTNILIQVLYYLKKFEQSGEKKPTTIFVGDKNECFALDTKSVEKYLNSDINWEIAPCTAHKHNTPLVKAMVDDMDILPFVFDIDENFTMETIVNKIIELGNNGVRKVKISSTNISTIYDYFCSNVISSVVLSSNQKANLFIQLLINPNDNYFHPQKKNTLCTQAFGELKVDDKRFKSFFKHFEDRIYSPKEKEAMTALLDRLIEDVTRRSKGEFYTPTLWVDEAHKMISEAFGDSWKDEYIVWDCSCGTGNLTRDYIFRELYCSTLEQSDIDTINQMGYNKNAVKFQFDFLNEPIFDNALIGLKTKVPPTLQQALIDGKKVLFLINPPYATANNMGTKEGDHKAGCSDTKIGLDMKENGWGKASQNLYAQFMYRVSELNIDSNVQLSIFCPSLYKTGESYNNFRKEFYKKFRYDRGMIFNASHFSDTANTWGIDFSIWKSGIENRDSLLSIIKDISPIDGIINMGEKWLYNLDNHKQASKWVREEIKGLKTNNDVPQLTSAINVKVEGQTMRGCVCNNTMGYLQTAGNAIYKNPTDVSLFSWAMSQGHGLPIIKENFNKVCSLFTARKSIVSEWYNQKDEYFAPNENHSDWEQFTKDSIVYSLFNNSSQQSSLRDVDYKGTKWDIKNEWFFMSRSEIMDIAEDCGYDAIYKDAKGSHDRYVYNTLQSVYSSLSIEAKTVLDMAKELTRKSMDMRQIMAQSDNSLHLDSWDCGYAQLRLVWKEYFIDEFNEFRKAYKTLEQKMIPMVYDIGFLKI